MSRTFGECADGQMTAHGMRGNSETAFTPDTSQRGVFFFLAALYIVVAAALRRRMAGACFFLCHFLSLRLGLALAWRCSGHSHAQKTRQVCVTVSLCLSVR